MVPDRQAYYLRFIPERIQPSWHFFMAGGNYTGFDSELVINKDSPENKQQ